MSASSKRATVYFDAALHRALRLKAGETKCSLSDLVNDAVRQSFLEDAEDLEAFESRAGEANLRFDDIVRALKGSGSN